MIENKELFSVLSFYEIRHRQLHGLMNGQAFQDIQKRTFHA